MIQQVNLYQGVLNQSHSGSKFKTVLWSLAASLFLLAGYCGFIAWNTHNLKSILTLRESDLQASKAALEVLQGKYPETQPDSLLIGEISRAQKNWIHYHKSLICWPISKQIITKGFLNTCVPWQIRPPGKYGLIRFISTAMPRSSPSKAVLPGLHTFLRF